MAGHATKLVARQRGQGSAAYWLYEHEYEGGIAELLERLDAMLREDRRMQVTAMILICKEDMLGNLDGRSRPPLSAEVVRLDREAGMASVSVSGEGAGGPGPVRIAKMQDPFVYLAVTDGGAAFVDRALVPFVQSLYPGVSEAALSSAEMRGALDILERMSGGTVRIAGVEACPEQDGAGGGCGGGPDAGERWDGAHGSFAACADAPYRDALDEAANGGRRIGRVQMRLVRDGVPSMECQISRRCLLRFRLSMRPFCTSALPYMAGLASGKTRLYSGRSRMENGGRIRALDIVLDDDVFSNVHENERLVRIIRSMPHSAGSAYSIFPYVHRSLVD